jgi:hypothetical protein
MTELYRKLVQNFNLGQTGAAKYAEGVMMYNGRDQAAIDVIRNMIL